MRATEELFLKQGFMGVSDCQVMSLIVNDKNTYSKISDIPIHEMAKKSYREFRKLGISHQRAIRLCAAFEINRRKTYKDPISIMSSRESYDIIKHKLSDLLHEEFWVIYMNRSNKVMKIINHSKGGIAGTVTDQRIILKEAILLSASSIICAHNHPSGNLKPSQGDLNITKRVNESAKMMDIKLLDHIIIADDNYFSFADQGLI